MLDEGLGNYRRGGGRRWGHYSHIGPTILGIELTLFTQKPCCDSGLCLK